MGIILTDVTFMLILGWKKNSSRSLTRRMYFADVPRRDVASAGCVTIVWNSSGCARKHSLRETKDMASSEWCGRCARIFSHSSGGIWLQAFIDRSDVLLEMDPRREKLLVMLSTFRRPLLRKNENEGLRGVGEGMGLRLDELGLRFETLGLRLGKMGLSGVRIVNQRDRRRGRKRRRTSEKDHRRHRGLSTTSYASHVRWIPDKFSALEIDGVSASKS
ncbi:unnamed protein product, partial [Mycena citricolor]